MRRFLYVGVLYLLFHAVYCFPALAADWEVYAPDSGEAVQPSFVVDTYIDNALTEEQAAWEEEVGITDDADADAESMDVASPSSARPSRPARLQAEQTPSVRTVVTAEPVPASSYVPYDASISTSVVSYMSDVLPKLGNVSYVLFRSGQYTYRLVYADEMEYSDSSGVFSSADAYYISYNSRDYDWTSGAEGSFTLRTNGYIVYSDVGDYPVLARDALYLYAILFLGVVLLLFTLYRSFFAPGRVVI